MINLDDIANESNKEHNKKLPYFPHHRYRIFIIGGSGSERTNALHHLINDKIYLHAKDLCEPEYEYLIKNLENAGIKHLNDSNAIIVCSNTMDNVYENIDDYNPSRNTKNFTCF